MAKETQITSKTRKDMKPRGKGKRNILIDALKECDKTESEFYTVMIQRALDPGDAASSMLMKEVAARLYPLSKTTAPLVEFSYRSDGTPANKIEDISNAVSKGELPLDMAKIMADIIKTEMDIKETTELMDRIAKLEEKLNA